MMLIYNPTPINSPQRHSARLVEAKTLLQQSQPILSLKNNTQMIRT